MLDITGYVPKKLIRKKILKENIHYIRDVNLHKTRWFFNIDRLHEISNILLENNRLTRTRKTDKKFGIYCY